MYIESKMKPAVLWFTGFSGSGKSTLTDGIYEYLKREGCKVERLDGDTVRSKFPNMGFSKEERDRHVKRAGCIAAILEQHGIIVISSFISPYKESRDAVRSMCKNFIEVHVATSLEECEKRDPKGLYKKVRKGEIKNFTGIDDPYEAPENPEIVVVTDGQTVEQSCRYLIRKISEYDAL